MKITLEHEPFAPVTLSQIQENKIKWLADALLDETLAENDDFVHQQNRVLDMHHWKQVIARENIAIYKRTGKGELGGTTADVDLHNAQAEPRARHWRLPLCVGVGTLAGTLDDLLYGQLAATKDECRIRSSYTKDNGADSRVLASITKPTAIDPLQLLLVRWIVLCQLVHKIGIAPRDVVQMESIGTRTLPNGERIGYMVVQSLELPGCTELAQLGIVRATYSSCFVFRAVRHGTIDVYMRAYMDPGGKLRDGIAVLSACMALVSIGRLMVAGQNKKLAYIARHNVTTRSPLDGFGRIATSATSKTCPLCLRGLHSLRSRVRCDLCLTKLCSRCIDERKLSYVQSSGRLVRVPTQICTTCMLTAAKMNASDVAAREHEPHVGRTIRMYSTSSAGSQPPPSPKLATAWLSRGSTFLRQSMDTITSESTPHGGYHRSTTSSAGSVRLDLRLDDDMSLPSPSFLGSISTTSTMDRDADGTVDAVPLDLWVRMNQLRVAAEETYILTKQNGAAMMDADRSSGTSARVY